MKPLLRVYLGGDGEMQRLGVDDDGGEDALQDGADETVHAEHQSVALPVQGPGDLKPEQTGDASPEIHSIFRV